MLMLIVSTALVYSQIDPGVDVICKDVDVMISLLDRMHPETKSH